MNTEINTFVDAKQLLGLDKVALLLDISKRKVQRLIAAHELPKPIKIGRLSKLTAGDVDAYIEKLKQQRNGKEKIVK
ncbi:MAG: helix-turn-helix transcriptional regulator [Limisphaerales bacterium]